MKKQKQIKYSIIIPVFNSEKSIFLLSEKIHKVFLKIKENYEIIFIDDKSENKKTWPALEKTAQKNKNVKIIQLTRNFGQQAATLCGIEAAVGEYIITMDDDLQHSPEDIPLLIQEKHDYDIVIGRFIKKKHHIFKRIASRIKQYFDYKLIGKPAHIQLSSFRLFNQKTAKAMLNINTSYPFIPALMFYITKSVVNVDISHYARFEGKTGYSLRKMLKVFSNLIINNSSLMLRFIGYMGIFISMLSFIFGTALIVQKMIYETRVAGWTSMMVLLLFLGGILLFTLGIIGEYLIRIISGIEKRPSYFIRKKK